VLVANIKAAGVGVDGLQDICNNVAFMELPWTPGALVQAIDRLHRIGATAKFLNIFYLLAMGTIEEDMAEWLDEQMKNISKVLDGKEMEKSSLFKYIMDISVPMRRKGT
jgi:SNF2 family DNA or RNA helicase